MNAGISPAGSAANVSSSGSEDAYGYGSPGRRHVAVAGGGLAPRTAAATAAQ